MKRWIAVGLGFVGVLIISKPGFDNLNLYYIYPVIFTLGFAGVSIFIRKLTLAGEPVYLIAFYFCFNQTKIFFIKFFLILFFTG